MPAVGIDLGTTYSCVAVLRNGKVEIIQNDQGSRTTPSCVAFAGDERLVGEAAKHQMARNPENTVYDAKRLIGQTFGDPAVQADMKRWAFKVTEDEKKPKISVSFKGEKLCLFPEEVSSTVLASMKKTAEDFIGETVTSAVITVPAYFSDAQRRSTKDAAGIAGFHVLGTINEPTAAAIAYGLQKKNSEKRNVLIFDLGGGTFDVTILSIDDQVYDVKATGGDTHLGGQDFNERLFSNFVAEFTRKNNVDIKTNQRAVYRLRDECEKAKKQLSSANRTSIQIDKLFNDIDFDANITRAKFEQLNDDLFRGTMETVEKVLDDANMDKKEIDDVVLVGGSTRIPCIQEMLEDYFGKEKVCKTINPDEAVAYGAAVQAAFLSSDTTAELNGMELNDVTPLSLGVETKGGIMTFFVKRNTTIPATKTKSLVTVADYQTSMKYAVYEGERSMTNLNKLLGSFTLHGIPKLPAGEGETDVTFDIDANGVLNVSAKEKTTGKGNNIKITWDEGRLSDDVIQRMIKDAEQFRLEDDLKRKTAAARNDLESLAHKGRKSAQNKKADVLCKKFLEILEWTENNENATLEVIEEKRNEVEDAYRELS